VLCPSAVVAKQIESQLRQSLALALAEFKRDKISKQNARLSLANSVYDNPTIPRRKILLSTGSHNYKPPLERSKSAPKLTSIEEMLEEEEEVPETNKNVYKKILRHYDSTSALLDKRKTFVRKLQETYQPPGNIVPVREDICDEAGHRDKKEQQGELQRGDPGADAGREERHDPGGADAELAAERPARVVREGLV
jgi:hypothetical protein